MKLNTTGKVLVTINAKSKEEALEIARKLKNFKLDESYGPIDLGAGKYVVRGVSTGPVK